MSYNWIKILHLFFVFGWMAGLFYLPRIFVHFQYGKQQGSDVERLKYMADKLFKFMTLVGVLGLVFGLILMIYFKITGPWLHIKLAMVFLLIVYQCVCGVLIGKMKKDALPFSHVFYRYFNEIPTVLLLAILYLVVMKRPY